MTIMMIQEPVPVHLLFRLKCEPGRLKSGESIIIIIVHGSLSIIVIIVSLIIWIMMLFTSSNAATAEQIPTRKYNGFIKNKHVS